MLLANITSLEIQVTSNLTAYATSSFKDHSLVSTVAVVQGVVSGQYLRAYVFVDFVLTQS